VIADDQGNTGESRRAGDGIRPDGGGNTYRNRINSNNVGPRCEPENNKEK
jgi:hypothetical protein